MGASVSNLLKRKSEKEITILIEGMYDAGKTTLLYSMKMGEVVTTIPTIGVHIESTQINSATATKVIAVDLGGRCMSMTRMVLQHFHKNISAIVYIIDSNTDVDQLEENRQILLDSVRRRKDELQKIGIVAVLANKQDLPNAWSPKKIADGLQIDKLRRDFDCEIEVFGTSSATKEGTIEAFQWITNRVLQKEVTAKVVQPVGEIAKRVEDRKLKSTLFNAVEYLKQTLFF